jgi:hypothetical protein
VLSACFVLPVAGDDMTRLILTADGSSASGLKDAGRADIVIRLQPRLVWGPLPTDAELAALVAARTTHKPGSHWLDYAFARMEEFGGRDFGLIELCQRCETVELWIETKPNDQLVFIWLLDYLRSHAKDAITTNLILCHVDATLSDADPKHLAKWRFPAVRVTNDHLEIASLAWQAYRAPTPQPWFSLLERDLSIFPQLRRCVLELLEELPGRATGLGASEMRLLELISAGYWHPFDLRPLYKQRFQRRVFKESEVITLLEGLALAPKPAVSGLAEWPVPIEMDNQRDRYEQFKKSRMTLTELGKAILVQADDFSRHNPIDRWWGGTRLTNDRLWRWNPALMKP